MNDSEEKIDQLNAVLAAFAEMFARANGHEACGHETYCDECRDAHLIVMFYLGRIDAIKTMEKAAAEIIAEGENKIPPGALATVSRIFDGTCSGAMAGTREAMPKVLDEFLTLLFEAMEPTPYAQPRLGRSRCPGCNDVAHPHRRRSSQGPPLHTRSRIRQARGTLPRRAAGIHCGEARGIR